MHSRMEKTMTAMPESYAEIERIYPHRKPEGSVTVEISSTRNDVFEDDIPAPMTTGRRDRRSRRALMSSGNIAGRQRLRRKHRTRPSREISVDIIRTTSAVVAKSVRRTVGVIGAAGEAYAGHFKGTAGRVSKFVKGMKKDRKEDPGDALHKYFYDLHGRQQDEVISTGSADEEEGFERVPVVVSSGGSGVRKQTWSDLGTMFVDTNGDSTTAGEEAKVGLPTIDEFVGFIESPPRSEAHDTAIPQSTIATTHEEQRPNSRTSLQDITAFLNNLALSSRNSQQRSPSTITSSIYARSSRAPSPTLNPSFIVPPSPPTPPKYTHPALRALPTSKDIFNLSHATAHITSSDPIKSRIISNGESGVEITRCETPVRAISVLEEDISTYPDILIELKDGTTKLNADGMMDIDTDAVGLPKWAGSETMGAGADRMGFNDDAWDAEPIMHEESRPDQVKSVRERVMELDLALDNAMTIAAHDKPGRRKWMGRWRGN
jgi:hypothetical protein